MSDVHPLIKELKMRRINLGLTQTAVAKAAGISKTAVCEIERGNHKPGLDVLIGMARGVGLVVSLELDPERHHRIEICDTCRQPWPCRSHQAVGEAKEAARAALQRALDKALGAPADTATSDGGQP